MFPLFTTGAITSNENLFFGLLIGIGFGFILEKSGFARASHIAPTFYFRSLRVPQMMISAIVTSATWLIIAVYFGWVDFAQVFIPTTYVWPYLLGGVIFGAGMIMSGWCPGTAVVGVAAGRVDAAVFLLGVIAGMYVYFVNFHSFMDFANGSNLGKYTIDKLVGGNTYTAYLTTLLIAIGLMTFMRTMKSIRDKKGEDI
jgi:uncharacterized protein